jgi:Ca2+-transporting ATPase
MMPAMGFVSGRPVLRPSGRARIAVPGLYRTPSLARRVEDDLRGVPGVAGVQASPITGRILVLFVGDPDLVTLQRRLDALAGGCRPGEGGLRPRIANALHRTAGVAATALVHVPAIGTKVGGALSRALDEVGRRLRPVPVAGEARPPAPRVAWHALDADEVLRAVGTPSAESGLSSTEAARRLAADGPNALPLPPGRSSAEILLGQFQSVPVLLLLGSSALSLATGGVVDAAVIVAVVLVNAGIGFVTERATERTIRALADHARFDAVVLRDGAFRTIPAEGVVRGDVVRLGAGHPVPAGARLLRVAELAVDESTLTGESLPVAKHAATIGEVERPLADRLDLVFRGTNVTGGTGLAVVVGTGTDTELGLIQRLITEVRPPETTMQRQLRTLGGQLVGVAGLACAGVFAIGLLRGRSVLDMLRTSVSLAVAAVPEGLPTLATTALALGVSRMQREGVLVRHLGAIENLGAVEVACLDKTGTLTYNRMKTVRIATLDHGLDASAAGVGAPSPPMDVRELLRTVALCNDAELERSNGATTLRGSPTESALVVAALDAGLDVAGLRTSLPRVDVAYRNEARATMTTVHRAGERRWEVFVKGRPEEVLARSHTVRAACGERVLGEVERAAIEAENERMAARALRVLGVAWAGVEADLPPRPDALPLCWLGLVGLADPPRDRVRELMAQFHRAGIDTAMVTGDQSATAQAIAREIGVARNGDLRQLDASHLERLDPEILRSLAGQVHVFSRVSPARKLEIVQALQQAGRVVAMTGDGINDGPALRAADVGIAMGIGGTDAARQVADVVLVDDRLETILEGIRQGRTIHDDIRKAVRFILATNASELAVTFAAIAAGLPAPLTPVQLLWLNLVTDIFPELALAVEPPDGDVLDRPPRDPSRPLFSRRELGRIGATGGLLAAAGLAAYGWGLARYGAGPRASTIAFMGLTSGQLLHAITARSEHGIFERGRVPRNPFLPLAVGGGLALQLATGLVPGLRTVLGTARLSPVDWLVALGAAVTPFLIEESTRWARHRNAILPAPGPTREPAPAVVSPSAEAA